jgi:hypothetical protein
MREILTALLDDFCPEDKFQEAKWWKETPETRAGVSKRQKIRYFIIGPNDFPIHDEVEELEHEVDIALKAHNNAISVAHGREVIEREDARTVLIGLEDII